jgi:hypothetical protein
MKTDAERLAEARGLLNKLRIIREDDGEDSYVTCEEDEEELLNLLLDIGNAIGWNEPEKETA